MPEQPLQAGSSKILLGRPLGIRKGTRRGVRAGQTRAATNEYSVEGLGHRSTFQKLERFRGPMDLTCTGEGHLMTIAPTGSGKGYAAIIPNLLRYEGSVIVTDPKGENYAVTARARRAFGQKVYKLDPFHVNGDPTDCLNPLDIFDLPGSDREVDAQIIGDLLMAGDQFDNSPIWRSRALGLLDGIIGYIASLHKANVKPNGRVRLRVNKSGSRRILSNLFEILNDDNLRAAVDQIVHVNGTQLPVSAHRELSSFLGMHPEGNSRDDYYMVLSILRSQIRTLNTKAILAALDDSGNADDSRNLLSDLQNGRPVSVYLIIPPDKLASHNLLLRLWIATIIRAIACRTTAPQQRTLLLVDECAQLGSFPLLEHAIAFSRSYKLQTWTFWQDVAQLKQLYQGWETMVNNCEVLQSFGFNNHIATEQLAKLFGIEERDIWQLSEDEQIVMIDGIAYWCSMCDYRIDGEFAEDDKHLALFDPNPYYKMAEQANTHPVVEAAPK